MREKKQDNIWSSSGYACGSFYSVLPIVMGGGSKAVISRREVWSVYPAEGLVVWYSNLSAALEPESKSKKRTEGNSFSRGSLFSLFYSSGHN